MSLSYTQIGLALGKDSLSQPSEMCGFPETYAYVRARAFNSAFSLHTQLHTIANHKSVLSVVKCKHKHQFPCTDTVTCSYTVTHN